MTAAAEGRTTFERALARQAKEAIADENARAESVMQAGGHGGRMSRVKKPIVGKVLLALAVAGVVKVVLVAPSGARGTRPLNAAALATADGSGLGSSPVGFLTEPSPRPAASTVPTTDSSEAPAGPQEPGPRPARPRGECRRVPDADTNRPADPLPVLLAAGGSDGSPEYAIEIGLDSAAPNPSAAAAPPPPTVVNMGKRLSARLESGVRTGA